MLSGFVLRADANQQNHHATIRETLRLNLQAGLSYNEFGRTLTISKSVVGKYLSLARVAGVGRGLAQTLSDEPSRPPRPGCTGPR